MLPLLCAQVMLSLVVDIKNNKKRAGKGPAPPPVLPPPVAAWLKGAGVADVCLRNLTWPKLLKPDKRLTSLLPIEHRLFPSPCQGRIPRASGCPMLTRTRAATGDSVLPLLSLSTLSGAMVSVDHSQGRQG